ncbi:predicted protein [Neisseria gonorrhoeae PID1]|nr:predicted protein [Neisseria gonorrhoeae PID18]EEZ52348.1 predicted protein [Neisseria gonorrhoeae PID1]EEZ59171.1 predicted protein [Neisseria gonorrhoeae SK-93-1035]
MRWMFDVSRASKQMPSENLSDGICYLYCRFSPAFGVFLFFSFAPKPKRFS